MRSEETGGEEAGGVDVCGFFFFCINTSIAFYSIACMHGILSGPINLCPLLVR